MFMKKAALLKKAIQTAYPELSIGLIKGLQHSSLKIPVNQMEAKARALCYRKINISITTQNSKDSRELI